VEASDLQAALKAPAGVTALVLERKGLKRLPPEIGALRALEVLRLDGNLLQDLPPEIAKLGALRVLSLKRNRLVRLPALDRLAKLETLDLSVNQLRALPALDALPALHALELGPNPPLRRPPEFLWRMTRLTRLGLFRFPLGTIPPELARLASLTSLEIGEPGELLEHDRPIPPAVFALARLEQLSIFGSSDARLSPDIAKLTSLRDLSLIATRIESLPQEIGALTKLESLTLDDNRLESLPLASLASLPALRALSLTGNPLRPAALAELRAALPRVAIES